VNFIVGTIPPVQEIVIVIADLYLPPLSAGDTGSTHAPGLVAASASSTNAAGSVAQSAGSTHATSDPNATGSSSAPLSGLEHIARFGQRRLLSRDGGWRSWLARRLGRDDLANVPPAVIAAGRVPEGAESQAAQAAQATQAATAAHDPHAHDTHGPHATQQATGASSTAWLATPLHRIAGLTTVHLDRRGLLQLSQEEAEALAVDFNRIFGDDPTSPLRLHALPGGALLLEAGANLVATTTEPARLLVSGLEDAMPSGPQATPLKRIGAEVEMWLHEHPLNLFRVRRGQLPLNALWLWGGGPVERRPRRASVPASLRLFGTDPYLSGLARSNGVPILALPDRFSDLVEEQCSVLVTEAGPLLHAHPTWSVFDGVAELDRRHMAPAVAALQAGQVERLTVIANDIELTVRRKDRLKFWRRSKPGLTGLQ